MAGLSDPTPPRLHAIQILRGVAAMLVVLHHALHARTGFYSPFETEPDFGRLGVLVFFVISGFVMMHACKAEPPTVFLRKRIIRIVPLYWLMTLVLFAILLRNDLAAGDPGRRVPELLQSLLFIPHFHSGVPTEVWPILVPGWTLTFEIGFFVLFAAGLMVARPGLVTAILLVALVLAGEVFDPQSAFGRTATSPFLLLFLAGMGLSGLWGRAPGARWGWALIPGWVLGGLAALGQIAEPLHTLSLFGAAVLIVAGTLGLEGRSWLKRAFVLQRIGDASYSIYLSHTIVMIVLYKALRLVPLDGVAQFGVMVLVSLTVCAAFGIMLYDRVEHPMLRALHPRRRRSPDRQAHA